MTRDIQNISPARSDCYRIVWQNKQFEINGLGDISGREGAGLSNWLILTGEAHEPRWLKLAARDSEVNFQLFAEALQRALAFRCGAWRPRR